MDEHSKSGSTCPSPPAWGRHTSQLRQGGRPHGGNVSPDRSNGATFIVSWHWIFKNVGAANPDRIACDDRITSDEPMRNNWTMVLVLVSYLLMLRAFEDRELQSDDLPTEPRPRR